MSEAKTTAAPPAPAPAPAPAADKPAPKPNIRTRHEVAILTLAEAIADVAAHAGYSGVKKLPDEITAILDGELPEEAPEPPAETTSADDDDGGDDDGEE